MGLASGVRGARWGEPHMLCQAEAAIIWIRGAAPLWPMSGKLESQQSSISACALIVGGNR